MGIKHPGEKLWNEIILSGVSGLSAFGSIAIIFTYFLWRDLQTTSRKILVYISFGDFFTVFPTLVIFWTGQYRDDNFPCKLQSFVTTTAVMWSFLWTTSLAIYLYVSLVKKRQDIAEKLMVIFHIINWCVPVIVVGIAWNNGNLGTTEHHSTAGWCWIKTDGISHKYVIIWMLVCGKLCEIITYFINFILYFSVKKNIKKEVFERYHLMSAQSIQIAEQGVRKLALVPIVFVLLRIWGTIRFILFAANIWQNNSTGSTAYIIQQILFTVQIIGDNSQGIANFILFCLLTEKFKTKISQTSSFIKATPYQHHGTFGNTDTGTFHS